ncbi:hypothetical protein [Methylobacterium flocculans]|uniref:hypothetical protein n=1 Tax=Methylobacterium flocculans TaxID=2984843 RepID=UPI0021F3B43E|nr:hypothetical protein [Methylobacterium sp. FF17]
MLKLSISLIAGILLALVSGASAQQGAYQPFTQAGGAETPAYVILCATGVKREAAPCGGALTPMTVLSTPFVRSGTGDPIIFDGITTTPKQFAITKPADATSYRIVNPCNVDIRIRKVSSAAEAVTQTTGTRILARSSETLGTSEPKFVSLITTATPSVDCNVELQYGRGG